VRLEGKWYLSYYNEKASSTSEVNDVEIMDNGWLRYLHAGKVFVTNERVTLRQDLKQRSAGE
jgi:hypothetical protein